MVHISAVFCTFFLQVITFYLLDDQSVLTAPVVYRKERSTCLCCAEVCNKYISSETFLVCNVMTKYNFFLNESGNHVGQ